MLAPSASAPSIPELLGGMLVVSAFAFALYGVTSAQAYVYSLNCKDDPRWMKWLVGVIWVLETAHSASLLRLIYYTFIISFGDYVSVGRIDWSLALMTLCEILIILLVEGYYIRRLWILSNRSRILTVFLIAVLVCRLGFTLCTAIYTVITATWVELQDSFGANFVVLMANSSSAVIDSTIAISMIILLRRGQAGFNRNMDTVLGWVIAYCVNAGTLSMLVSTIIAITYSTLKGNLLFAGLVALMGKVYANSLLGMLNARPIMREQLTIIDPNILGFSGLDIRRTNERDAPPTKSSPPSHASEVMVGSNQSRHSPTPNEGGGGHARGDIMKPE